MAAAPTLYLHIGRNKAGSTTLQDYFAANAPYLRGQGIEYVFFGQPAPQGSNLPSFPTHRDIAEFARAQTGKSVLVSHEGLCCFTPEMTRIMATDLATLDTRIVFYIRPYREWLLSSYNFDVRTGHNSRDIDAYLAVTAPRISIFPMLDIWGQTLGWDKIRVRSLHPADLAGGGLLADALTALGLDAAPPGASLQANRSPAWWVIELLRLVARDGQAQGWTRSQFAIAAPLHELTDVAVRASQAPCPPTPYLTSAASHALTAQYNADLAKLHARTGIRLQPDAPPAQPERPFLPRAAAVPRHILDRVTALALAADTARVHPELAVFVREQNQKGWGTWSHVPQTP
jgi:hypothetical protein